MRIQLQNACPSPGVGDLCLDRFPAVIGRADDCNIPIPMGFISRQHCRFIRRGDEVLVQDLESLNGTFVNGRLAALPTPIHHGDEVRVGPLPFRVTFLADNDRRTLADHSTPFEKTRC